jgi:hypothetical protein
MGLVCYKLDITGPHPSLARKWRANITLTNACASPIVGVSNIGIFFGQQEFSALVWIADVRENTTTGGHAILQAY